MDGGEMLAVWGSIRPGGAEPAVECQDQCHHKSRDHRKHKVRHGMSAIDRLLDGHDKQGDDAVTEGVEAHGPAGGEVLHRAESEAREQGCITRGVQGDEDHGEQNEVWAGGIPLDRPRDSRLQSQGDVGENKIAERSHIRMIFIAGGS